MRTAAAKWHLKQLVGEINGHVSADVAEARHQAQARPAEKGPLASPLDQGRILVLVSASLGQAALRQIAQGLAGHRNAEMVFRGLPAGIDKIDDGAHALGRLIGPALKWARVVIDPRPFRKYRAAAVPEMIWERGKQTERVRGITNPEFFLSREDRRDFGQQGPVTNIVEPDLGALIKAKAARIDWAREKRAAFAGYWRHAEIVDLPPATASVRRVLDMSVVVTHDIRDGAGHLIVTAGTKLDPVKMMPFRTRLLVIDPNDRRQIAWAKAHAQPGKRNMVLIADFHRASGWAGWRGIGAQLGLPAYILTPDVRARFHIARVPAEVEEEGGQMILREGLDG